MNHPPARTRFSRRHGSGFTLIELLIVIAIIATLAAILFPDGSAPSATDAA